MKARVTGQNEPVIMPGETGHKARLSGLVPWLAGAGMALGHIAITSHCTLGSQGRCSSCGNCLIAIISLSGWAISKQRKNSGQTNS